MSYLPPNYNVTTEPIGLSTQEYINKLLFDQTVVSPVSIPISFADFYALMPSDNGTAIALGDDVAFPNNGPSSLTDITRVPASTTSFKLGPIGTYQVTFSVPVSIAGQLVVTLNNVELAYGVFGRAAITSPITGSLLITTSSINNVVTIRNPVGNAAALPITVNAGGASAVSAHLVITRVK